MPLSPYGRTLAANSLIRKRKKTKEGPPKMTELTILKPGVEYYDDGKHYKPAEGEVVAVLSPSVVRTLTKTGRAVEGRTTLTASAATPIEASESPITADFPNGGDDGTGPAEFGAEKPFWRDVDGISKPSLNLLEKNVPDANPLTATSEDLLQWLEGSMRRHRLVEQALARWKSARSTGSSEDV